METGPFRIEPLPWNSATTTDILVAARRRTHVHALVEVDVTRARELLQAHRQDAGVPLSTTGWIACCAARALSEFPALNCHRMGARRRVIFDDVDVMVLVEREAGGVRRGLPVVVRAANRLSVRQVHDRIREAQGVSVGPGDLLAGPRTARPRLARIPGAASIYPHLPAWLRAAFWRLLAGRGTLARQVMGTVGITAVGMFGKVPGWPLAAGLHTVELAVGSIVPKPRVVAGAVLPRDVLHLTVSIDHGLVDGAEAARFVARLSGLLEAGHGLEDPARSAGASPDGSDAQPG